MFLRCKFYRLGAKEELQSSVDVTYTEHNRPHDQASNKVIEEAGVLHEEETIQP